jgi:hypothetical protein
MGTEQRDPRRDAMMNTEPMRTVIEALDAMVAKVYEHTGRQRIKRLVIDRECGLCMGIPPGTAMKVSTSCGEVEILCEMSPQDYEDRIAAIGASIEREVLGRPTMPTITDDNYLARLHDPGDEDRSER